MSTVDVKSFIRGALSSLLVALLAAPALWAEEPVAAGATTTGVEAFRRYGTLAELPQPPVGVSGAALARWKVEEHVATLEAVVAEARRPNSFTQRPNELLARLGRCGYELPVPWATERSYDGRALRTLKRASTKGNVAAAVLLAHVYDWRAMNEHDPGSVPEALVVLPAVVALRDKASAYSKRARQHAERKLEDLRRELAQPGDARR